MNELALFRVSVQKLRDLHDAVDDCEECLVHFPTFRRLGEEVGLELVEHMNFHDYFERNTTKSSKKKENIDLAKRMRVFDNRSTMTPDQWEVTYLYRTFVFRKKNDSETSKTEGHTSWLKAQPEFRRCEVKDIVVLTKDCTPEAQGIKS
ncbi:hypothetical protein T484DRAFT_1795043 [Baffinella frigidus]|nr:hypothetical protein T484DRAFT_1795043 [Cryptophyta sp. CCMP2293]